MKRATCEYERRCPVVPNAFCATEDRFDCVIHRNKEERQMIYEDDL